MNLLDRYSETPEQRTENKKLLIGITCMIPAFVLGAFVICPMLFHVALKQPVRDTLYVAGSIMIGIYCKFKLKTDSPFLGRLDTLSKVILFYVAVGLAAAIFLMVF